MRALAGMLVVVITLSASNGFAKGKSRTDAFLKVESSDSAEVLTFTCAYATGDEKSVSPLVYREERTPFTLTITADRFVGLFRVKSGNGTLMVSAQCGQSNISARWPVVVLEKEGLLLKTEGF